jgi:hypothetical protein
MITTTYPPMVKKVYEVMGRAGVTHHTPTPMNSLGQSGLHTLISDIMDIMEVSMSSREQYKNLYNFFEKGEL